MSHLEFLWWLDFVLGCYSLLFHCLLIIPPILCIKMECLKDTVMATLSSVVFPCNESWEGYC